jgi:hypothetical protein
VTRQHPAVGNLIFTVIHWLSSSQPPYGVPPVTVGTAASNRLAVTTSFAFDSASQDGCRQRSMARRKRSSGGGFFFPNNQTPFAGRLVQRSSVPYQKTLGSARSENGSGGTNGWVDGFVTGHVSGACASNARCNHRSKHSVNRSRGKHRPSRRQIVPQHSHLLKSDGMRMPVSGGMLYAPNYQRA